MIVFNATYVDKVIEEDHFEKGCIGGLTCTLAEKLDIEASTFPELIAKISKEFGLHEDLKYWTLNKENSHLFYSVLEDDDGVHIENKSEDYKLWEAGKIKGWLAEFRFHVCKNDVQVLEFDDNDCADIEIM